MYTPPPIKQFAHHLADLLCLVYVYFDTLLECLYSGCIMFTVWH